MWAALEDNGHLTTATIAVTVEDAVKPLVELAASVTLSTSDSTASVGDDELVTS
jgi:hypothetical protein